MHGSVQLLFSKVNKEGSTRDSKSVIALHSIRTNYNLVDLRKEMKITYKMTDLNLKLRDLLSCHHHRSYRKGILKLVGDEPLR